VQLCVLLDGRMSNRHVSTSGSMFYVAQIREIKLIQGANNLQLLN